MQSASSALTRPHARRTMKLSGILFSSLLCVASVRAQYFSAGWTPGQPAPKEAEAAPAPEAEYTFDASSHPAPPPRAAPDTSKLGFGDRIMVNILSSPTVQWMAGKVGMNITEAVERGSKGPWDDRIPLITDENYDDLIVNEQLTDEELRDRVWILVMCVRLMSSFRTVLRRVSGVHMLGRELTPCLQFGDGVPEQCHFQGRGQGLRRCVQHDSRCR